MKWLASLDANAQKVGNRSRFETMDTNVRRFLSGLAHTEVIHALGVMRVTAATPYLIGALQDRESTVSDAAIQALGEMGSLARPLLESVLTDPNRIAERRREAVEALGASDDPEAIPTLLKAIRDPDNGVSAEAVEALSQMTDLRAFQAVVGVLEGSDQRLAKIAAQHLGSSGYSRSIEPLRKALRSADQEIRSSSAQALAKLGDSSGADILLQSLGDAKTRRYAAAGLGLLGDLRAFESLTTMLSSKDNWERGEAAQSLGRLGDHRAIPGIVKLLADSERHVRLSAAAGLAMLGDLRGFDTLIRGLWLSGICDHEQRVAIEALGRSGDGRAVTHLVRALRGAQKKTRRPLAEALARLGDSAVDALLVELADPRPIVRLHAAEALCRIGDSRATDPLARLARADVDEGVRVAAASFINKPASDQ
ncbi:MAG: HEAT repeat domain-containing protein [Verrucomicrobiota bacterium]|jgi:HEAT repeat protein